MSYCKYGHYHRFKLLSSSQSKSQESNSLYQCQESNKNRLSCRLETNVISLCKYVRLQNARHIFENEKKNQMTAMKCRSISLK